MRMFLLLISVIFLVSDGWAQTTLQEDDGNVVSQRGMFLISPVFQRWSLNNGTISEASAVLTLYHPLSRAASLSLRGSFAATGGDPAKLSGLNDLQLAGSYYWEQANLIFSLGVSAPTGKKNLTLGEFQTSSVIAENVFRFQVPNFGAGLNISPSIMWALPLGESVVMGLGTSMQYRGEYTPIENAGTFKPGIEVLGTIGFDVRMGETSTFALDVAYARYGKDKLGGVEVFSSGNKVRAVAQFKTYFERDELVVLATYRSKGKAEAGFAGALSPLNQRLTPNQGELMVAYATRLGERLAARFSLEGRFFESTPSPYSGYTLVGIGASPEVVLSDDAALPIRLRYFYGTADGGRTLKGFEFGVGLALRY